MKIEAILLHSERFAELADFYRRAMDLPEPTPLGDSHVGWPSTTPYLGFDADHRPAARPGRKRRRSPRGRATQSSYFTGCQSGITAGTGSGMC